ncbi:hypothetical protein lerEdw1_009354 [Lerista edwardsae]|nr:hypothetical protein lerEdw1_009354 [Lerista edwardsae]
MTVSGTMAEAEEKEPKSNEESTDESEEEESEEEPKLKYERLSNGVTEILQKDVASCMTVHEKFLALGTHYGKVYLLDVQGNITQKFDISPVKINQISLDESGEHLGVCSEDGKRFAGPPASTVGSAGSHTSAPALQDGWGGAARQGMGGGGGGVKKAGLSAGSLPSSLGLAQPLVLPPGLDVDECAGGRHNCDQDCLNVAGSFRCACQPGYKLRADGKTCQALEAPTDAPVTTSPAAGASNLTAQDEVKELRNRVLLLEEKLQLALAPFLKLDTPGLEGVPPDPLSLLAHSLRQLDRIDSLSEQISFLEERLETCSCKNTL